MNENNELGVKKELGSKPEIGIKPELGEKHELFHRLVESELKDIKKMNEELPQSYSRITQINQKIENK